MTGLSLHWLAWIVLALYLMVCLGSLAQGHWNGAFDDALIVALVCWVGHLNFMLECEEE